MGLDGKYEGKVTAASWAKYEGDDGKATPYIRVTLQIGEASVSSSLWFDNNILDKGQDAGKTRVKVSMEVLASYGVKCDPENIGKNDPSTFPAQLVGKTLRCFCDMKGKDGAQRCFINAAMGGELDAGEIKSIWADLFGGTKPPQTKEKPPATDEPKEELPF